LRVVTKPDENAGADGGYKIRSLYFDNYTDKAMAEKLSGLRACLTSFQPIKNDVKSW